ncbi:calcium-transporting ATPase 12, plasma membrane-type-like [Camellia sinensis]|uniref:calcium-transporting ATPase 12, plasma membrane-type-like n=1 Tax=Camellia sinensis TaxID=4442 RepID=UPI0010355332|nr:calcium-transporting ATPase 12, plasma membrane-type-like [Camellia sinensis]
MLQTNTSGSSHHGSDDDAGGSLRAGLLTTTTTTSSSDNRYRRLWQRGNICVGLLIALNKRPSLPYDAPPPPSPQPTITTTFSSPSLSDDAGGSLRAGLLTTTTTTTTSSSANRYRMLWQRGNICVGLLIALNKRPSLPYEAPPPPSPQPTTTTTFSSPSLSDDAGGSLRAGLLTTTTTTTTTSSSANRYRRLWQRGNICVGLLIALNKRPSPPYEALPSPPPQQPTTTTTTFSSRSLSEIVIDVNEEEEKEEEERGGAVTSEVVDQEQVNRIVKHKDLKSLRDLGGVEQVAILFNSDLVTGLCACGDDLEAWNTTINPFHGLIHYFIKSSNSYTIFLLLISAALSLLTETLMEGLKYGWADGVTILASVFLLVTVPAVTNFVGAMKLKKKLQRKENKVEVTRDGSPQIVGVSRIRLGDIVNLKEGDRVPADGLFVGSGGDKLVLDEVFASEIDSDHNPFLLSGFKVLQGNGRMIVTSVGTNTVIGKVMSTVNGGDDPNNETLLQTRIERPIKYADKIGLCITILITAVVLFRFLRRNHVEHNFERPELKGNFHIEKLMKMFERILLRPRGLVCVLTTTLTAVVLGFQNGVSLAITLSLSYWNQKVSDHANPQTLSACSTIGFSTVFCIDLSAAVMFDQMKFDKFFVGENEIDREEYNISKVALEALQQEIGMNNLVPKSGRLCEAVLAAVAMESREMTFNEKGKGVLMRKNEDNEKIMHLHWRRSAQTILRKCSRYYDYEGTSHALDCDHRREFEKLIKGMEDKGLHPIAFAYQTTYVGQIREEDGLILLALVGVKFKEETESAMEGFRRAGVSIKFMMGDELSKAHEAEDKLLLIRDLKAQGHVVAFFGGLTASDTPALKEADVGITKETQTTEMARESSDMARESSDIILFGQSGLSSLTQLLKHGRCVYHNLQKFIVLQLTTCISGILITSISTMSLGESPITAIQLVWANLIVCMLGGIMMTTEPPTQGLMAHQPQPERTKSIMSKVMWRNFTVQVVYQTIILLAFQFEGQQSKHILEQNVIKTMIFNTFILCQIFNVFNAMELEKKEIFMVVIPSYYFLASVGVVLALQVLWIELGTILTNYARLNCVRWAFCFLFSALSWGFDRVLKFLCLFLSKPSVRSVSSQILFPARTHTPHLPLMGLMSSMILLFSFNYYFNSDIAWTMR